MDQTTPVVHAAVVLAGLWSPACADEPGWSAPLADAEEHPGQVTCSACLAGPAARPTNRPVRPWRRGAARSTSTGGREDRLRQVVADLDADERVQDLTFYFVGSTEPFSVEEFTPGSDTRRRLDAITHAVVVGADGAVPGPPG